MVFLVFKGYLFKKKKYETEIIKKNIKNSRYQMQ
jgi:hypothetical protein